MNKLPPFNTVLFDWDNTLADNWNCVLHSINHVLTVFNHPTWSEEEGHRRIRKSSRDLFTELFGAENLTKASEEFYTHFEKTHLDVLRPMEGTEDLLEFLKEKNIYTGIVSNKKGDYLRKEVTHLQWDKYFDVIIGANDAAKDKPHPDPIILALDKIQQKKEISIPFDKTLYVGDTETDIEVAQLSGCIPVFLHTDKMRYIEKKFLNKGIILQFNGVKDFYVSIKTSFSA